jgi:hypothetical protein
MSIICRAGEQRAPSAGERGQALACGCMLTPHCALPCPALHRYVVLNRPYAFAQWINHATIPERFVLMSEPDHIFIRPLPNFMTGGAAGRRCCTQPASQPATQFHGCAASAAASGCQPGQPSTHDSACTPFMQHPAASISLHKLHAHLPQPCRACSSPHKQEHTRPSTSPSHTTPPHCTHDPPHEVYNL